MDYAETDKLQVHTVHAEVYGDGADEDLIASVGKYGVIEPLAVMSNHQVISGARRLDAAKLNGLKRVPVHYLDPEKPDEMAVHFNCQRVKTNGQKEREYQVLRRARSTAPSPESGKNFSPSAKPKRLRRTTAAKKAGISQPTADKAAKVREVVAALKDEGKQQESEKLSDILDKNVSAAYRQVAGTQDANRQPVPEDLKGIFEARVKLRSAASAIATAKRIMRDLEGHPGLALIDQPAILHSLDELHVAITARCPHAVCVKCKGKGCAHCGKRGWTVREQETKT